MRKSTKKRPKLTASRTAKATRKNGKQKRSRSVRSKAVRANGVLAAPPIRLKQVKPAKADIAWAAGLPWSEDVIRQITLTPSRAAALLARFTKNQRETPTHRIQMLADIFEGGHYDHRIALMHGSTKGKAVNGFHRLWALMHAGLTVKVNMQFGVDPAIVKWIDIGQKRSGADSIKMLTGWPKPKANWANSVLRKIYVMEGKSVNTYTPDQALRCLKARKAEIEWGYDYMLTLSKLLGSENKYKSACFWGPLCVAYRYVPKKAAKFARDFMTADKAPTACPAVMLRNHGLIKDLAKFRFKTRLPTRVVERLTLHALHVDATNARITHLSIDMQALDAATRYFFTDQAN
jgi:hypothetical protein